MYPLKKFVQGPSLHDETVRNDKVVTFVSNAPGKLKGDEARKAYEEIINLPSTSSAVIEHPEHQTLSTLPSPLVKSQETSHTSNGFRPENASVPKLSRLFSYCESNKYDELQDILSRFESEIDINLMDEYGWTLLMSASCAGSLNCVSVLLQNGANWYLTDKRGQTALCLARKSRQDAVCKLIEEWSQFYKQNQTQNEQNEDMQQKPNGDHEASSSTKYCENCKVSYESTIDSHGRSIAHLICSEQFGSDKIHFGIPESNKGFQLMMKSGWNKNSGLGPDGTGQKFPVKTVLKRNKLGLGNEKEIKAARITHFGPFDPAAVESQPKRLEREVTVQKRDAYKQKCKNKRKEIQFRREFSSL